MLRVVGRPALACGLLGPFEELGQACRVWFAGLDRAHAFMRRLVAQYRYKKTALKGGGWIAWWWVRSGARSAVG